MHYINNLQHTQALEDLRGHVYSMWNYFLQLEAEKEISI